MGVDYFTHCLCHSFHFYFAAAVIVSGGESNTFDERSVETLHSDGTPWCSLPDLPRNRQDHSQTGLEACGGKDTEDTCVHFKGGSWEESQLLQKDRRYHSSWASPEGTILMGASKGKDTKTTELLSHTGESAMHFPLKFSIS